MSTDSAIINKLNNELTAVINEYRHTDMDDTNKLATLRNTIEELKTRIAALVAWSANS